MKKILIFTFLFVMIQGQSQEYNQELTNKINIQMKEYVEGISPGIAAGIVKDGEIVYEKYIGHSNLENQIKINKNTSFNIASNAKQFTALCILKLIDQEKLKLEDDIRKYKEKVFIPNVQLGPTLYDVFHN